MTALVYLPSTSCDMLDEEFIACRYAPLYVLIEANGEYMFVCARHIDTDRHGNILPRPRAALPLKWCSLHRRHAAHQWRECFGPMRYCHGGAIGG